MPFGNDFIIGHTVRDLVLARLKHYHLEALKVAWEFERRGQWSLLVGGGLSREVCWTAGFLELCEYLLAALNFLLPHPIVQCFQHKVSPGCRGKPLLGRQVITTHFWACALPRHVTLGLCPGDALVNAHARELERLQGCESTADVPGMAEDHGRRPGLAPSGNFELSHFCSPSDRRRGCVASGWCLHFRSVSSERRRMRKSCLSLCPWHLGWFWFGYSLSWKSISEYLGFLYILRIPAFFFFLFFSPPSLQDCNISRNASVYHDVRRKGQLFLSCEIISLNSDFFNSSCFFVY